MDFQSGTRLGTMSRVRDSVSGQIITVVSPTLCTIDDDDRWRRSQAIVQGWLSHTRTLIPPRMPDNLRRWTRLCLLLVGTRLVKRPMAERCLDHEAQLTAYSG